MDTKDAYDAALKVFVTTQNTALSRMHWSPTVVTAWTTGGYLPKIVVESGRTYLHLLNHLISLHSKIGWTETQKEVKFYAKELTRIREAQPCRIAALCRIYVFLRDGYDTRWRSPKLINERMLEMRGQVDQLLCKQTISDQAKDYCPKCRLRGAHQPGKEHCPWKDMSNEQAKKCGMQLFRNLGQKPLEEFNFKPDQE